MKNERGPVKTTQALEQLCDEARTNKSGIVLSQGVEVNLPPRLENALNSGRRVLIDYTGNVSVQGE